MVLWICEKPSQASDISKVLGVQHREDGYIQTKQGVVTWCYGHLVQQLSPEEYNERYKKWCIDDLPIIPPLWKVKPSQSGAKQLHKIGVLLKKVSSVIISTDADREGEAIGREVLDYFHYKGDIKRLWLSALDENSIKNAITNIMPGKDTAHLYEAAKSRAYADWLIGMNLTRAASISYQSHGVLSVGRVQTPTLALVVQRDLAIASFKPQAFYELVGTIFNHDLQPIALHHKPSERIYEKGQAESICNQCEGGEGVCNVTTKQKKQGPPKLFSLSGLQKEANEQWGWSADYTLKIAQSLYETHKATTYPRSDCIYLPEEQKNDVKLILNHLSLHDKWNEWIPGNPCLRESVFNTEKVTAHHAIIPTTKRIRLEDLSSNEALAYKLICQRYILNLNDDYLYEQTCISVIVNQLKFEVAGKVTVKKGWKSMVHHNGDELLPTIMNGTHVKLREVSLEKKITTPPKLYTEGSLITDMAAVAKFVQTPSLKSRLKETSGIGTEATRASIIEVLKKRNYIKTKGKQIISTKDGRALVDALPNAILDPGKTAVWEDALEQISNNELSIDSFLKQIQKELNYLLHEICSSKSVQIGKQNQNNPPTTKMLSLAKRIASSQGKRLSKDVKSNFNVCKDFLDKHLSKGTSSPAPSEKQIKFAQDLAKKYELNLPETYKINKKVCSQFISTTLQNH